MPACFIKKSFEPPSSGVNLPNALEAEVHVRPPPVETLHVDASAEILRVRPAQGQSVSQTGYGAQAAVGRRDGVEAVHAARPRHLVVLREGGEGVGPYARQHLGRDAAAAIPYADSDAGGVVVQRHDGLALELPAVRARRLDLGDVAGPQGGLRGDGDDDGLLGLVLHRRAEGILEHLGDDVLEVHGHAGKHGVGLAIDYAPRPNAVAQLAYVGHEAGARLDHDGRLEGGVYDAYEGRVLGARRGAGLGVEVRLGAVVQGDVLLGDEPSADPGAQVLVEEARHLGGVDVPPALEEAAGEDGYGVGVRGDELSERLGEADLVLERGDERVAPGRRAPPVGQEDGERVQVGAVYAGDVGVRDDDVGQVAEGLQPVREADREEGQREVGRREQGLLGEGRSTMSTERERGK